MQAILNDIKAGERSPDTALAKALVESPGAIKLGVALIAVAQAQGMPSLPSELLPPLP